MTRRGFTLLEVLVATAIMAIAVTTALSALRGSLRNADRSSELDRIGSLARRKMGELLAERLLPRCQGFSGTFAPEYTGGIEAGWSAMITPSEVASRPASPGAAAMERVQLEVWWRSGSNRRTMPLEAYRRAVLTLPEAEWMQAHSQPGGGVGP